MKKLILITLLVLSGCANNPPVLMPWPGHPTDLDTPTTDLTPLATDVPVTLTDLIENANDNFAKYYILKEKYEGWQTWDKSQKQIHDSVK